MLGTCCCDAVTVFLIAVVAVISAYTDVWHSYGNREYLISRYIDDSDRHTYNASQTWCRHLGGDLAVIPDLATHNWLVTMLPKYEVDPLGTCNLHFHRFWIGLQNLDGTACGEECLTEWSWTDGSKVTYNNWDRKQPGEGNRLGLLYGCAGYKWHTLPPRYLHRFICSRDFNPVSPSEVQLKAPSLSTVENEAIAVSCTIPKVYPGAEQTNWTVLVDGTEVAVQDESEAEADNGDGTVTVQYTGRVTLKREYQGKKLQCQAAWMDAEPVHSVLSQSLDVKYRPDTVTPNFQAATSLTERQNQRFVCTVSDSNPKVSDVEWRLSGTSAQLVGVSEDSSQGMGKVRSVLVYDAIMGDNGRTISCTPVWQNQLLTGLQQSTLLSIQKNPNPASSESREESGDTDSAVVALAVIVTILAVALIIVIILYIHKHRRFKELERAGAFREGTNMAYAKDDSVWIATTGPSEAGDA